MNKRRIQIYVPGILTFPGSSKNWSGKAVTYTHNHTPYWAEKCEFLVGIVGRALGQKKRAEKLATMLSYYRDWDLVLVGHSNGTDVILKALRDFTVAPVRQLHLVCAACEANFDKNGLNRLIRQQRVGQVFVYVAEEDKALRAAHTCLGRWLGYGTLGLNGPKRIERDIAPFVTTVRWEHYGHSDCWADSELEHTLQNFVQP